MRLILAGPLAVAAGGAPRLNLLVKQHRPVPAGLTVYAPRINYEGMTPAEPAAAIAHR